LESGQELWRLDELNGPSRFSDKHDSTYRFVASPAIGQGWIIIPTAKEGPTIGLKVDDQLRGSNVAQSSNVRWKLPQTPDVSIPLIANGLVYNLHKDGKLQCIELETGKEVYIERTHSVQHRASPVMIGEHLYLCAKDGLTSVVKAGRTFEIVAKNKLDEPITASPAVAGGTLYLRTYNALYAIE
jgi:outer membrane protein assembly factor BamB